MLRNLNILQFKQFRFGIRAMQKLKLSHLIGFFKILGQIY